MPSDPVSIVVDADDPALVLGYRDGDDVEVLAEREAPARASIEKLDPNEAEGCPHCDADPDYVKEREGDPGAVWGTHVCTRCGCELFRGDGGEHDG
jgi:hypothetical protein